MASSSQAYDLVINYVPDFDCYIWGRIFPQSSHEMLPSCTFIKVKNLKKLLLTTFYLLLLTSPISAFYIKKDAPKTAVTEHKDKISVHITGCRSLSPQELKARMGSWFDESKMAFDNKSLERSTKHQAMIDKDNLNEFENEDVDVGNLQSDDGEIGDIDDKADDTVSVQHELFMRKKRYSGGENTNLVSDKIFLYQNMISFSLSQGAPRSKRSVVTDTFHPPWECKKKKTWLKMKEGYFPSRILDGTCKAESCFYGLYTCNPVKYTIKVLMRDPTDACKPVPLIGQNTTYEESWILKRFHVTVACECGRPGKTINKKRNRNRDHGD